MSPIPPFTLAVKGAPYPNKDGSNRAFEIKLLDRGAELTLRPEPKNKYDEHAVAVHSGSGVQIGYIDSERAPHVGLLLRAGHQLHVLFQEPTPWGCLVRVGVDHAPSLPQERPSPKLIDELAQDDPGFEPDWIPPDD